MDSSISPEPFEQICEHLRLLGYKTESDEIGVQVTHIEYPYFRLYKNLGGVGFLFPFEITKGAAASDPAGFFALLNEINEDCVVARFYYDAERERLFVAAWYPSYYDRVSFGVFFDRIRQELATPKFKYPEGIQKYLTA